MAIVVNSFKALPRLVLTDIINTVRQSRPEFTKDNIIYNDPMDISRLGEEDFIETINDDKNKYIALYTNYFNTNDLNEIRMRLKNITSEEKQSDEYKELLNNAKEIKDEYDNLANKITLSDNPIQLSKRYKTLLEHEQIVNMYWNEIKPLYQHDIKLINTLSKDFNKNEFKDMLDYAKTYKRTYFIVDKMVYDSLNVQGIDLGHDTYYVKF